MSKLRNFDLESLSKKDLFTSSRLEASAGTGKTYTLERLVCKFIESGLDISEILIVTFTKKAASELKERVRALLVEKSREDKSSKYIKKALFNFDESSIYTIHGFCNHVIKSFPFESGSSFNNKVSSDDTLVREVVFDFFRKNKIPEDLELEGYRAFRDKHPKSFDKKKKPSKSKISFSELTSKIASLAGQEYMDGKTKIIPTEEDIKELLNPEESINGLPAEVGINWFLQSTYRIIDELNRRRKLTSELNYNNLIDIVYSSLCSKNKKTDLINLLKAKYKILLIDEFQDTDHKQWEIFSAIFNDNRHVYWLIGDPKQSIYGFRGADLNIYHKACSDPGTINHYRLGTNYRSSKQIVKFINYLFEPQFKKSVDGSAIIGFEGVDAGSTESPLQIDGTNDKCVEILSIGNGIESLKMDNARRKWYKAVVAECCKLLSGNYMLNKTAVVPGDIAIIVENKKECSEISNMLESHNIPVVVSVENVIDGSEELELFRTIFKAINYSSSSSIVKELLLSDLFNWQPEFVLKFVEGERVHNYSYDLLIMDLKQIKDEVDHGRLISAIEKLFLLPSKIEDESFSYMERVLSEPVGDRKYTNIRHIIELLHNEQKNSLLSSNEILRSLNSQKFTAEKEEREIRLNRDSSFIQIMTIHKSKGLQFPITFFSGGIKRDLLFSKSDFFQFNDSSQRILDFSKNPSNKVNAEKCSWEEKKRLYYVGMTRAKNKLYLPYFYSGPFTLIDTLYQISAERLLQLGINFEDLNCDKMKRSKVVEKRQEVSIKAINAIADYIPDSICINSDYSLIDSSGSFTLKEDPKKLILNKLNSLNGFGNRRINCSSFSDLTGSRKFTIVSEEFSEEADRDPLEQERIEDSFIKSDEITPQTLPRGTATGDLLHDTMELDFSKPFWSHASSSFEIFCENIPKEEINQLMVRYFDENWSKQFGDSFYRMIWNVLSHPIHQLNGTSLAEIPLSKRRAEMEFLMKIEQSGSALVDSALFSMEKGYLKGFIDLIFEWEGKIYILDWKSSSSPYGDSLESYRPEYCRKIMEHHHYRLQYLIYLSAVERLFGSNVSTIEQRKKWYEEKFGGAFYIFCRGVDPSEQNGGIFFERPDWDEYYSFNQEWGNL